MATPTWSERIDAAWEVFAFERFPSVGYGLGAAAAGGLGRVTWAVFTAEPRTVAWESAGWWALACGAAGVALTLIATRRWARVLAVLAAVGVCLFSYPDVAAWSIAAIAVYAALNFVVDQHLGNQRRIIALLEQLVRRDTPQS